VLIQGINALFTEQLPEFHIVIKSTHYADDKYSVVFHVGSKRLINEKAKFKVALRLYLNTHPFLSVDKFMVFINDSKSYCQLYVLNLV
jgi:hypothetical protein